MFQLLDFLVDEYNSCYYDYRFQNPFYDGPRREATISARFVQATVALCEVDAVKDAQSASQVLHLAVEPQVDEQIVESKIENNQD